MRKVAFVAQETPLYSGLSVADHLHLGTWLNRGWDADVARERIVRLGLDPKQKAGSLSGGQRARLALTLAIAKRPDCSSSTSRSAAAIRSCENALFKSSER